MSTKAHLEHCLRGRKRSPHGASTNRVDSITRITFFMLSSSRSISTSITTALRVTLAFVVLQLAASVHAQTPAAAKPASVVIDQRATAIAQLLGGIVPAPGDPVIDRIAASDAWLKHREIMTVEWKKVRTRLETMEKWRDAEIRVKDAHRRTLLYPFSGPDFINAWALFPNHARYMFFGLENPGTLPELEKLGPAEIDGLLRDVRNALDEIIQRNYFITSYMGKELVSPYFRGTVPIMSMMMALDGLHIVKIERFDLFPELTKAYEDPKAAKRPGKLMRGARMTFTVPNSGRTHELYYFSLDATDRALQFYPELIDWLVRDRPVSALLKSASYLLHDNQFAKTREMVINAADILVQDDTGVPLRFLRQTNWQVRVFGKYHRPIKPMEYGYQRELEVLFKEQAGDKPLPFPFGYHWRGEQSGLILATRPSN
jgi:hypothetical protein